MSRTILFLWVVLLLLATPVLAQDNPIFTATNNDEEALHIPETPNNLPTALSTAKGEDCDIIELKRGGEILAHIVAVEDSQIKYQKCYKIKRIDRIISKVHVMRIRYANGDVLEIQKEYKEKKVTKEQR